VTILGVDPTERVPTDDDGTEPDRYDPPPTDDLDEAVDGWQPA
jgi:hypothetical protein